MKTINLHNFGGIFEIHGYGSILETHSDGRCVFFPGSAEEALAAAWEMNPSDIGPRKIYDSHRQGWSHNVFAIHQVDSPSGGDYGWIWGDCLEDCIEEYFRVLSENGMTIAEDES